MADTKISGLTAITSCTGEEVLAIVDEPGGTPVSRKITRDNLIKNTMDHGMLYTVDNTTGQTLNTGAYTKLDQFTAAGPSLNTTCSAANDDITVANAGTFLITFSCSFSGTASVTWDVHLFVSGATCNQMMSEYKLGTGGDIISLSMTGLVALAAGDTVDIRVQPDGNSKLITCRHMQLALVKIL